jgi:hypothetical protein
LGHRASRIKLDYALPGFAGGTTAGDAPAGLYTYSLVFDDPGNSVEIQWSSDNGSTFSLNGGPSLSTIAATGYSGLVSFTILASAFNSGVGSNTFTVVVSNDACPECGTKDNPTGLLVSANAVPLPAALPLFGSALAGMGVLGWRRRKSRGTSTVAS